MCVFKRWNYFRDLAGLCGRIVTKTILGNRIDWDINGLSQGFVEEPAEKKDESHRKSLHLFEGSSLGRLGPTEEVSPHPIFPNSFHTQLPLVESR